MQRQIKTVALAALISGCSFAKEASDGGAPHKAEAKDSHALTSQKLNEMKTWSQAALSHIESAQQALQKGDDTKAKEALTASRTELERLYIANPASPTLKALDKAAQGTENGLDLAPLMSDVSTRQIYLDPKLVAGIKDADSKAKAGDKMGAQDQLRLAREQLVADMAFLPVEDAYARVLASKELLDGNQREQAQRMLKDVSIAMTSASVGAPLVAARFDLRTAAAAVEAKNWSEVRSLLDSAANRLREVSSASVSGSKAKAALDPIAGEAEKLQKRVDGGEKPSASELRALAEKTRAASVG